MKFLHTGDLHIGKTVNEFSMIEEQRCFLEQIAGAALKEKVDAVVVAGDVYDRSIPSVEAVGLLNDFLSGLTAQGIRVLMISGNHDSPERIGFANQILEKQGLHIASICTEEPMQVMLEDKYGKVNFVLLPYVKPAVAGGRTNQDAVELMLGSVMADMDVSERNVLVTHYFVTAGKNTPELSDSETSINVGGLDNVEAATFGQFDYVALGHIHKAQRIGEQNVYYAGTPIKYSFSETAQKKGVWMVTLMEKGDIKVEKYPIFPIHDMRKIRGKLEELVSNEVKVLEDCNDYIQATLTDEEELIDPLGTLRSIYPNMMQIILAKNEGDGKEAELSIIQKSKSMMELYEDFFVMIKGYEMDEARRSVMIQTIKEAEGDDYAV